MSVYIRFSFKMICKFGSFSSNFVLPMCPCRDREEFGADEEDDRDGDDDNQPEDLHTSSLSFTIEMDAIIEEEKKRQERRAAGLPDSVEDDKEPVVQKKFRQSSYFSDEEELADD